MNRALLLFQLVLVINIILSLLMFSHIHGSILCISAMSFCLDIVILPLWFSLSLVLSSSTSGLALWKFDVSSTRFSNFRDMGAFGCWLGLHLVLIFFIFGVLSILGASSNFLLAWVWGMSTSASELGHVLESSQHGRANTPYLVNFNRASS